MIVIEFKELCQFLGNYGRALPKYFSDPSQEEKLRTVLDNKGVCYVDTNNRKTKHNFLGYRRNILYR